MVSILFLAFREVIFKMLGKEFETYFIRCKKCGKGKPKEAFKGSINRVCLDCRGADH